MKNKNTTIGLSKTTKKRLLKCDQYMTKERPSYEDRVIWLMDKLYAYYDLSEDTEKAS